MHYNEGYPSDIVALSPQGTNSTMFTACCEVAIVDSQPNCPHCDRLVVGHDATSEHERHKRRWDNATRFWSRHGVVILFAISLCGCGCQTERGFPEAHQIRNFDRVTPELWRGAQPNAQGFRWLASQGCKTVINLRELDQLPNEFQILTNAGIIWYRHEPMSGVHAPNPRTMKAVLACIDALPQPVFVHCEHGCDRTGTVIACWRIRHGWSNADALREAEVYGLSRWEWGMRNFIKRYHYEQK